MPLLQLTYAYSLFFVFLSLVSPTLAGPACAYRNRLKADCITKCDQHWGWPGYNFGNDPWGLVMMPSAVSANSILPNACGFSTVSSPVISSNNTSSPVANPANTPNVISTQTLPVDSDTRTNTAPSIHTAKSASPSNLSASATSVSIRVSPSPHPASPTSSRKLIASPSSSITIQKPESTSAPLEESDSSHTSSNADVQTYLTAHNTIRAQHGAKSLSWSNSLAAKAQQWSNKCVFEHSGGTLGPLGENLAAGTGTNYGIIDAVKDWTDEAAQYDPGNPQPSHFTQVVWKGSTQVGCAVQECSGIFPSARARFYVCEYSPQGNILGEFGENVQA